MDKSIGSTIAVKCFEGLIKYKKTNNLKPISEKEMIKQISFEAEPEFENEEEDAY